MFFEQVIGWMVILIVLTAVAGVIVAGIMICCYVIILPLAFLSKVVHRKVLTKAQPNN